MRYIFLILTFTSVFICCKKSNTPIENINGSEYFPNTVGDYWKYKYVDSLDNSTSVVEVNIVGDKTLPNGRIVKIWTFNFTDHVDTNYVDQTGDTIRFLNLYLETVNTYIIPLTLHNKWESSFLFDSIEVKDQRSFLLNSANFNNSSLLDEHAYSFNYSLTKVEWFCPNIGMLTRTRREYDLGFVNNSYWELLEYQLK